MDDLVKRLREFSGMVPDERARGRILNILVTCDIAANRIEAMESDLDGLRNAYEGAREDLLDWRKRAQAAEAKLAEVVETLAWYRGNVSWCNNYGPEGTDARDRLAKDRGKRAEETLTKIGEKYD